MLYELNTVEKTELSKVDRVSLESIGWDEKDLERLLSKHIWDLISTNDLMTIFTERPRQEEPDIIAVDKAGDLYIFELKRWKSNQENLLQVLRYGQLYGNSTYGDLNDLYRKTHKGKELVIEHQKYFTLNNDAALKTDQFNRKQHFLIVTNGLDQKTIEAIMYWRKCGLNIDGIVYWVFKIQGKYYIEFNMYSPIENQLEYESGCYILNTNYKNEPQSHNDMMRDKKAAAYRTGWKEKIDKLQKGDIVFLYQSQVGIVAYGKADGKLKVKEWDGLEDEEHYMNLDEFIALRKPVPAFKIKEFAERSLPFLQTMFSIDEETAKRIVRYIEKEENI